MTGPRLCLRPLALLDELGITTPGEIDVDAIAEHCGATIVYEPLEGCEARLLAHGDRAIITVNAASPRPRRRFSGAHELGHWTCDPSGVAFVCRERILITEWSRENPERRANIYAAELLLPEPMFRAAATDKPITFSTVQDLSSLFQTNRTATAIRLVDLGSFPAMLVCHDRSRRCWFRAGPSVPSRLRLRDQPGSGTLAYRLLERSRDRIGPRDVYSSEWFDHEDAGRYVVTEDAIRIPPEMVLSLLWWRDEQQLLDFDQEDKDEPDD